MNATARFLTIGLAGAVALSIIASPRTRTTQSQIRGTALIVQPLQLQPADSTWRADDAGVDQAAITIRGFAKRAGDTKESFMVTNNTHPPISAVRLLLRYSSTGGAIIHERKVTLPVTLKPGGTQMVDVRSFDTQRLYYYHAGPKPRKQATPFTVSYWLLGYDIPVGQY